MIRGVRILLIVSIVLNLISFAAFSYYVHRRGGLRYLMERAGFARAVMVHGPRRRELIEQQESRPVRADEVIFAGDSIVMRAPLCEALTHVKTFGISADISEGLLQRLDGITRRHPAKLFVQIGTNDLLRGIPIEQIIANFSTLIRRVGAESPNTTLFLVSVLPVHRVELRDLDHERKLELVPLLNAALRDLATRHGIAFIDLNPSFVSDGGELDRSLSIGDGVHLNLRGYQRYVQALEPFAVGSATISERAPYRP
jgi:lysophospholipase L1-like esterase